VIPYPSSVTLNRTAWAAGRRAPTVAVAAAVTLLLPSVAMAYVGPGAGLTLLGALWAVLLAVLFAVAGLLIWPIRTMLKRRRQSALAASKSPAEEQAGP
jgi:protein-S-isoprenylcysteine O-methyltransferase Ste14